MYIILIITLIIIITIVVINNIIIIVAIRSKLEGQSGVDSKLQGIRTLDSQPKFFLHLRARDRGDDNDHYDDDEDDGADYDNGDAHDAIRERDLGMNMMIAHVMEVMTVIMVMMITIMVLEMMTVRIGG